MPSPSGPPRCSYNDVRRRLAEVAPHFARMDAVEAPLYLNKEYYAVGTVGGTAQGTAEGAAQGTAVLVDASCGRTVCVAGGQAQGDRWSAY